MTRKVFASLKNGARGLSLTAMVGLILAPAVAAQTGTIVGTVTDGTSARPLESAQVYIEGAGIGTLTNSSGRFLLVNVPVGDHTVIAELVGYAAGSETVSVTAGGTTQLDFAIAQRAIALDEIVITGAGVATEKKKLGNTIATVDVSSLQDAPISDFNQLIQGREAGVTSLPGGGYTGAGSRIRIRGSASLSQSNEPIVYVDGVRVDNGSGGQGFNGAPQSQASRLDDIDPNSIERIEILKGAAAATLYGTEASNGVIQIFTKRGRQGTPSWTFQTDQAAPSYPTDWILPASDFPRDADDVARMNERWGINIQPFEVFENEFWNDIFETGHAQTYAGSVNGGGDLITYFTSGRFYKENGPFGGTNLTTNAAGESVGIAAEDLNRRLQGTANINIFPMDNLRVRVTGLYSEVNQESPENGNNIYGVFPLAMFAQPRRANANNLFGNAAFATVLEAGQVAVNQDTEHFAGSVNTNWTIQDGLVADVTFGVDMTNSRGTNFAPFGYNIDGFTGSNIFGSRTVGDRNNREVTGDFKLSWTNDFTDQISNTLLAGAQGFVSQTTSTGGTGTIFPGPGLEVAEAASTQSVDESFLRVVNAGGYLQDQIGYQDWAFLTVGGRWDANSAFGDDFETAFYPKASLSIVPTDLFDWQSETVSTFRVRAAWGKSGLQPGAFDKFTTFGSLTSPAGPGVAPDNLGNDALKPEESSEWELGAEAGFFNDRFGVDLTYWNRTVTDALVNRQFAVTGGFRATQLDNIGEVKANGVELALNGSLLNSENLTLNVFANTAYISEEITDLGGAPPLKTGGSYPRYRNFLKEGYSPGAFFGAVLDPNMAIPLDLNGDCSEPTRADALAYFSTPQSVSNFEVIPVGCLGGSAEYLDSFLGKPTPDFAGSFGFTLGFLSNFEMTTNFEYKMGDFQVQDLSGGFRQANAVIGQNTPDAARTVSTLLNPASTAEQRLEAALFWANNLRALSPMSGMNMINDADMLRLRELSLTYRFPGSLVDRMGLTNAALTVGGRNLKLWMNDAYTGIDPEINPQSICSGAGTDCNFLTGTEAFGVPIPRTFTFALRIGF
ncbi:MAG: SusC/RagA family TonB-linked outer membrane protein [Longimicrobiales bacterium]